MRSFLLKGKQPTVKWGRIPSNIYFEGKIPQGYGLAISPSDPYVILDIDRHGKLNGFTNVPKELEEELYNKHFNYKTKNSGLHVWLKYTGNKTLINRASGLGIDLRNSRGYVRWYLDKDIRSYIHQVKETSSELNTWLEKLFTNNT